MERMRLFMRALALLLSIVTGFFGEHPVTTARQSRIENKHVFLAMIRPSFQFITDAVF